MSSSLSTTRRSPPLPPLVPLDTRQCLYRGITDGDLFTVKDIFSSYGTKLNVNHKVPPPYRQTGTATPLMIAAQNGQLKVALFLLNSVPNIDISKRDQWGRTALNYACEHGHLPVVKLLVQYGIDASSDTTLKGMTALMHAACGGHLEIVKYLIESCGCSPFGQCQDGLTAVMWAYMWKRDEVVRFFQKSTFHFLCHDPQISP